MQQEINNGRHSKIFFDLPVILLLQKLKKLQVKFFKQVLNSDLNLINITLLLYFFIMKYFFKAAKPFGGKHKKKI